MSSDSDCSLLSSDSNMSPSVSSTFSDSDEEIVQHPPRPRIIRDRSNPLEMYDYHDFKIRFRFSKNMVHRLVELLGPHIESNDRRNFPIRSVTQILITLRFYATGSFQIVIGDHFYVSVSYVCRIIDRVSHCIASLSRRYIKMPETRQEIRAVCVDFYNIRRFPSVCGAIDCTHIKIQSPGGNNAEIFRNRKGWFSINVQVVCDANLHIRDIVCSWAGSTHDSRIFNNSRLKARLEDRQFGSTYLLGDSAYACKKYLLTPILNPSTRAEERYNEAHIQSRNTIERTFGVWKRRFPCLSVGMALTLRKILTVIVATAVLHNMARNNEELEPEDCNEELNNDREEINENIEHNVNHGNQNYAVRNALINTVFSD